MVRFFVVAIAASGALASVLAWILVLFELATPHVKPIEPVPAITIPIDRVDSLVVSTGERGYLDLIRRSDGSWWNIVPGGRRDIPTETVDQLFTLLEELRIDRTAVGWNERRYGPPAMNIELRGGDDLPEEERFSSIWFGSREAQGPSTRATVRIAGVPIGHDPDGDWQLVRIGSEKLQPSGAVSITVAAEIEALIGEWLHDPSAAAAGSTGRR